MVAPNATAFGRPLERVVSSVTSIIGANDNTSAQMSSRNWICVSVAMAVPILIAEGSLVVFFEPTPLCEFNLFGIDSVFVDAHMVLPPILLAPLSSGALVAVFIAHRQRYLVGSKLHVWTLRYTVAAFALSWTELLAMLARCNQNNHTLTIIFYRLQLGLVFLTSILLIWLSVLKLRCLNTVAPSLARVGEMSWRGLTVASALCLFLGIFVDEQSSDFLLTLRTCAFVAMVVATAAFFGVLVMVLIFSANSAFNEASQHDIDDESARHLKISASWTRWTIIVSAFAASTFCAQIIAFLFFARTRSAPTVVVHQWAYALDQLTNNAASGFLSGILFGDGDRENGSIFLKDVAASVHSQKRRSIEQKLISVVGASTGSALTVAHLMDGVAPNEVLREAQLRFRCITWEVLAARCDIIIGGGPLHVVGPGGGDLYSLSEPCHLGDCDFFVSHSWHDDGLQKWEALRSRCDDFVQAQGYQPRLWIDKICICQTEIVTDLRCLPVFLAGCKKLLIISGPTYPTRLWCAMEMLVHRAILTSDADRCPQELLLLGDDRQRKGIQQAWGDFDVAQCNCFNREDKHRFLGVVSRYPAGSTGFNRFVRELAADLLALSEASSPMDDYDCVVRC